MTFDLEEFNVNSTSTYVFCSFIYSNGPQPIFERQGDIGFNNVQGFDDEFLDRGFFDRNAPTVRVRLNEGEVSLEEHERTDFFSIFPNPASDAINVRFATTESTSTTVNVIDITGKVIRTINLGTTNGTQQISIDLNELTTGIYFVELVNDNGTQIKKFVKK